MTVLYEQVIADARAGTASPRRAIKAKCLECVGFVRKDITHCTSLQCPLYAYRPYQAEGYEDEGGPVSCTLPGNN
jgi:hypothetical protein